MADYVQVPPDGAGKKLLHHQHTLDAQTLYAPVFHLASHTDPVNIQDIDVRGQAAVRFAEGSPTMDAFSNIRVANSKIIGGYEYSNDAQTDLFSDAVQNGGSVTYTPASATVTLGVTGANGSSVSRTTNRYHFYQPGCGNLAIITCYLGDSGKPGNVRRWGYFDQNDGLFFELSGTTLNVVLRSSNLGQEIRVPSTLWNGDKLDGTGKSGMTIDVTKANFYWIDYAWLGVGVARFGILGPDGQRWVVHTFENPNSYSGPYMRTGSLPMRWENTNTALTAGSSELNLICAAVYSENRTDYVFWRYGDIERTSAVVTTDTHILSMRPTLERETGVINRTGIYPESIQVYVTGGAIKLSIYDDATITSPTWVPASSLAEYDVSATVSGGDKFQTWYLGEGTHNIDVSKIYETNDEGYHVLANGLSSQTMSLVATKLGGTTVTVSACLNYRELN